MPYQIMTNAELSPWIMKMVEASDCQIHRWHGDGSTDPALLKEADGFFVYGHPLINGAVMDTMPNLRVISNQGVGIDHIDLEAAKARGIPVGNTPGFVDGATADMTFALLMAAARNVVRGDHFARGHRPRPPELRRDAPNDIAQQFHHGIKRQSQGIRI